MSYEVASDEAESACDEEVHGTEPLFVGWVAPVPRFAHSGIVGLAVDDLRYYSWVIPRSAFFVGLLVVVETVDEVEEPSWFVAEYFEAMPVLSGDFGYLETITCRYDFAEFMCFVVVGADFDGASQSYEVVDLALVMTVPSSDDSTIAFGEVDLSDFIIL
jgi:hypothetical protein